jgi:caffeoyl-CoA O-methyltransferase
MLHNATTGSLIIFIKVCVDDFSDEPESEAIARKALEQAPNASRIHIVRKPGRQALLDFAQDGTEPFDFVFIDADKESQIYYYDTLLEKGLLSEHGLICVDNTLVWQADSRVYAARCNQSHIHETACDRLQWYSKVVTGETDVTTRAVHDFNEHVARDPRTQKVIIPMRDGLTVIRRL